MNTYLLHINGIVQGVGFRPTVYKLATELEIKGEVHNSTDGVYIKFNASAQQAEVFYDHILSFPPPNAKILSHQISQISAQNFNAFQIIESNSNNKPNLPLTPDIALCASCMAEISDSNNLRYNYPFTTCLQCGPRYSIQLALPYDRMNTSMHPFPMCPNCQNEYHLVTDKRYYSQTNSCPNCSIELKLFGSNQQIISKTWEEILPIIIEALQNGKTIAVKGIGGYLLLCDATNKNAIQELRIKKHRPNKPLAILVASIQKAQEIVSLSSQELEALQSPIAPIVIANIRSNNTIAQDVIAPNLNKIGVMLPYSPLLYLLSKNFNKPLVATSGNISGSPIFYNDQEAVEKLATIAQYLVVFNRDIQLPQDDSVMQFTKDNKAIILRRSRGLAPNYIPNPFNDKINNVWAMGSDLKSTFAILDQPNLYVSQYLGNLSNWETQGAFLSSFNHLKNLLHAKPSIILIDNHPNYISAQIGKEIAAENLCQIIEIQHHHAHFSAVLAENNLLETTETILGFIWDGTGYGTDNQIWGSELFQFSNKDFKRLNHLQYFPQLLGDKMAKEPRLSALSILSSIPQKTNAIQSHFTSQEWQYYLKLIEQEPTHLTSSMGRFLDAVSAIINCCTHNSFEGEAAMRLEALAMQLPQPSNDSYPFLLTQKEINWHVCIEGIMEDVNKEIPVQKIAAKTFNTLVDMIKESANLFKCKNLAFSGGVFQNLYLVNCIKNQLSPEFQLYFHQQLSPNDECISFGQIAYHGLLVQTEKKKGTTKENTLINKKLCV